MSLRQLRLASGHDIPYLLIVSPRRRTIGLRIDRQGLTVHVPQRMPRGMLERVLHDKSDWIARKLAEWSERPEPGDQAWHDGSLLQYLGQEIRLSLRQDARNRAVTFDGLQLHVALPDPADSAAVRRKVALWYAKQARADFARRIELLAARLGVPVPPLYLSNARTRWGSCNARGEIRLHWRLMQAPPAVIHYVVAHELAHLKEMNHSPKFWAWVAQMCPDYLSARETLKSLSASLHVL